MLAIEKERIVGPAQQLESPFDHHLLHAPSALDMCSDSDLSPSRKLLQGDNLDASAFRIMRDKHWAEKGRGDDDAHVVEAKRITND
jgi:hypothetical protein